MRDPLFLTVPIVALFRCRQSTNWCQINRYVLAHIGPRLQRPRNVTESSFGAKSMSRLDAISDWLNKARQAGFRISVLAANCGISEQHLRRYLEEKFKCAPHVWLMHLRLENAPELLSQGLQVKEVAAELGFRSAEHFSRSFKRHFKASPSNCHRATPLGKSQTR